MLIDTVGFIRDMPEGLFAAFRATFEEAAEADLVLQVVDASDPEHAEHERTTAALLDELDLSGLPRLTVYNKLDRLEPAERDALERLPDSATISALRKDTTLSLLRRVSALLGSREAEPLIEEEAEPAPREQAEA